MEEENNEIFIDINKLSKTLSTELEILWPLLDTYCIYRAPKRLRLLKKEAYIPRFVSIGPYHRGQEELKPMEEHKKRYLQYFLQRSKISLGDLVRIIAKNENKLRNCYAEIVDLSSDQFVKIILIDSIFIIEFLLRLHYGVQDFIINKSSLVTDISIDLCLFENQVPFFILEELFNLLHEEKKKLCLREVGLSFATFILKRYSKSMEEESTTSEEIKHLLDFLRICTKPSKAERRSYGVLETPTMPTATQLHQAGVKFRPRPNKSICDIKFSNGVMEIPPIVIGNYTEILNRNLLALEQCHDIEDNFHNDYVEFMTLLANTSEDVELLVQKGIIKNFRYDSKMISDLLRNLAETFNICPGRFYYAGLVKNLNQYYKSPWHKWKATLKRDYFCNPWAIVSVIAAAILLIFTVMQTVCSIMQL